MFNEKFIAKDGNVLFSGNAEELNALYAQLGVTDEEEIRVKAGLPRKWAQNQTPTLQDRLNWIAEQLKAYETNKAAVTSNNLMFLTGGKLSSGVEVVGFIPGSRNLFLDLAINEIATIKGKVDGEIKELLQLSVEKLDLTNTMILASALFTGMEGDPKGFEKASEILEIGQEEVSAALQGSKAEAEPQQSTLEQPATEKDADEDDSNQVEEGEDDPNQEQVASDAEGLVAEPEAEQVDAKPEPEAEPEPESLPAVVSPEMPAVIEAFATGMNLQAQAAALQSQANAMFAEGFAALIRK